MASYLLTRDKFREVVFERDNHACVLCGQRATDAHHILERKLWENGGYYLNNGASVCAKHHQLCETTEVSVEEVREAAGITQITIPEHFYSDQKYDKWGNIVLNNGLRTRGDLFYDDGAQKALAHVLNLFTKCVKYPRTYHVPWSPGTTNDDRVLHDLSNFVGKEIVVTEKLDGENTSLYTDDFHARSVDGKFHPSRSWAKNAHAKIAHEIQPGWRICCENMYAKHSIAYDGLEGFLYGLSVWDARNVCVSWTDTKMWFTYLELPQPDVLYEGIFDENILIELGNEKHNFREGYVIRLCEEFSYKSFKQSVAKYVRANHVQSGENWMFQEIIPNKLK